MRNFISIVTFKLYFKILQKFMVIVKSMLSKNSVKKYLNGLIHGYVFHSLSEEHKSILITVTVFLS